MNFINKNKKAILSIASLAAIVFAGEIAIASVPKNIELNVDEEIKSVETTAKTVEELLIEQGYTLSEVQTEDELEMQIKNNATIVIDTQKEISFRNQGNTLNVTTFANSVEDFLSENGIVPDEDDLVTPRVETKLINGESISYDNVVVEHYSVVEEIPYEEVSEFSFDLNYGDSQISQEGVLGSQTVNKTKTTVNDRVVSDTRDEVIVDKEAVNEITLIGTKEVEEVVIEHKTENRKNNSMYKDQKKVIESGSNGVAVVTYENRGDGNRVAITRVTTKEPVTRIVEVGTKSRPSSSSARLYSLRDFKFRGIINWSGYKFTYYSQSVLPGGGLRIPGRHVNSNGFVADSNGYIVLASSYSIPKGTVINTPFGAKGKVYDRCASCSPNWYDVYVK